MATHAHGCKADLPPPANLPLENLGLRDSLANVGELVVDVLPCGGGGAKVPPRHLQRTAGELAVVRVRPARHNGCPVGHSALSKGFRMRE